MALRRAIGVALLTALAGLAETQAALEHEIKAVFLSNFARYFRWPANRQPADSKSPIVVGVLGADPFGPALEEAFRGQTAQGRPISVRRLAAPPSPGDCEVLFVAHSESRRAAAVFAALAKYPVLTVGETEQFLEFGAMIAFTVEKGKVRFEIDIDAVQRSGLGVSAQLLKLARAVRGKPKE